MATEIKTSFEQQCDASGNPMSGAKVYVYDVGTTTLRAIWTDTALSNAGANPIIADSAGRHDMRYTAVGSYKIVVKTSADVTAYTRDNIDGRVPVGSGALAIANGGTGATSAGAALTALGGATAAELADIATDVAALSGALASVEKTHIATGTTAQRPTAPVEGDIRRNTTTGKWEAYTGSVWNNFDTATTPFTEQYLLTGTAATYTTPAGVKKIRAELRGGGGGGSAATTNSGGTGGTTIFNSIEAIGGGGGGTTGSGGVGGTGGTGSASLRLTGSMGGSSCATGGLGVIPMGGGGAPGFLAAGAGRGGQDAEAGIAAAVNTGAGGGGGCGAASGGAGGGGGAGEYVRIVIDAPAATYTYTIGAAGAAGAAGVQAGGAGGTGIIVIQEYY